MTRDAIVTLLESRTRAFNSGDVDGLTSAHATDGVVDSPLGGHAKGHEAIRKVYQAWTASFPDASWEFEAPLVDGERVAQVGIVQGTDMGGFMGLPPTRKKFAMPIVFLYTIRDGKIQHERRVYDFTGFLIQLGVLKAKPA
jgi:steroid delta-isomerase-like uncharacterized protein